MAAKDRDLVRIYGDEGGEVYVAPKGTTGPTTLAAPGGSFTAIGWLDEDGGIDFDRDEEVTDFNAWQGGTLLRRKVTSVIDTFKFVATQEDADVLGLYYKGVEPTTASSVDTFAITNQAVSDERAWVVDMFDDTIQKRYVIPSGEVTGRATVPHKNAELTMYEFTVTIYGSYSILKTAEA